MSTYSNINRLQHRVLSVLSSRSIPPRHCLARPTGQPPREAYECRLAVNDENPERVLLEGPVGGRFSATCE
jgi:hypothetical protein